MSGVIQTRRAVLGAGAGLGLAAFAPLGHASDTASAAGWTKLAAESFRGKQDDISFVTRNLGWYGNGEGKLYRTIDGGRSFQKIMDRAGTFVRALGFIDERQGFLGNVGPDYFPNVTDPVPLYRTKDGGETWTPVTLRSGPAVKGICAIDIAKVAFINHGVLSEKVHVRAAGRVGGPAFLMESLDGGETFDSRDLGAQTGMILDIKFLDGATGFIAGASSADAAASHGRILKTTDNGRTWRVVYESKRPFEITWKISFPSASVGYVTLQSYNPDQAVSQRYLLKTTDGGETWSELPLRDEFAFRAFGVGFIDETRGFVGGSNTSLETRDGGATWAPISIGRAVNKFRIVRDGPGASVFSIGAELYRLDL